ncbi:MAG: 16S rRNA (adenine(1518)-N(6)/adenine(1519)-N(6))-dimethyltransferase RsmA [Pseudoflavonifractor sp.]|nr:16S rRNA (adenine(1518)-N(6)/adenine(1519)-N(6))-dimethyltransferase RsmA [Alloprevotella sp.]MCM1117685.1 16S rRNA (adenine(1518)-N(6)/adenine(1519)-N(6))-dimethyltransferase RsmA [Pseudoflavonifractor sp.]
MKNETKQVRAKKALGQHFLTDEGVGRRIAATLDDYVGLPVIEVGPGMGFLSQFLLEKGHDLTVMEIDGESIEYLRREFPSLAREGRILGEDFLKADLGALYPEGQDFCVIGNYPYNISSQIFFHILEYRDRIPCCSGMLQREVAERLAAPAGGRDRGILSVLLQAWYDVEYLFTVDEKVFNPPPKVKSGVIKLTRNGVKELGCDERAFKSVVKGAFAQRRKMLRSSLKGLWGPGGMPAEAADMMTLRPEQLTVADFVRLTNMITSSRQIIKP